jgi:hypothetical protein
VAHVDELEGTVISVNGVRVKARLVLRTPTESSALLFAAGLAAKRPDLKAVVLDIQAFK